MCPFINEPYNWLSVTIGYRKLDFVLVPARRRFLRRQQLQLISKRVSNLGLAVAVPPTTGSLFKVFRHPVVTVVLSDGVVAIGGFLENALSNLNVISELGIPPIQCRCL